MKRFHRRARSIHAFQFAVSVEDENTVRHRVESGFPFGLSTRHHLEQFGLSDADCHSFCECFDQRHFIFRPHVVCDRFGKCTASREILL